MSDNRAGWEGAPITDCPIVNVVCSADDKLVANLRPGDLWVNKVWVCVLVGDRKGMRDKCCSGENDRFHLRKNDQSKENVAQCQENTDNTGQAAFALPIKQCTPTMSDH